MPLSKFHSFIFIYFLLPQTDFFFFFSTAPYRCIHNRWLSATPTLRRSICRLPSTLFHSTASSPSRLPDAFYSSLIAAPSWMTLQQYEDVCTIQMFTIHWLASPYAPHLYSALCPKWRKGVILTLAIFSNHHVQPVHHRAHMATILNFHHINGSKSTRLKLLLWVVAIVKVVIVTLP